MVPNLKILNVGARWLDSYKFNISDVIPAGIEHLLLTVGAGDIWSIHQFVELLDSHPSLSFLSLPELEDPIEMDTKVPPFNWRNKSWPNLRELIIDHMCGEEQIERFTHYIPYSVFPNLERLSLNVIPMEEWFRPLLSLHGASIKALHFTIYDAETDSAIEKEVLESIYQLCPQLEEIGLVARELPLGNEGVKWTKIDKAFTEVTVLALRFQEYEEGYGEYWEWFLDNAFRWARSMLPKLRTIRFYDKANWEYLEATEDLLRPFLRKCQCIGITVENNLGVQLKVSDYIQEEEGETEENGDGSADEFLEDEDDGSASNDDHD